MHLGRAGLIVCGTLALSSGAGAQLRERDIGAIHPSAGGAIIVSTTLSGREARIRVLAKDGRGFLVLDNFWIDDSRDFVDSTRKLLTAKVAVEQRETVRHKAPWLSVPDDPQFDGWATLFRLSRRSGVRYEFLISDRLGVTDVYLRLTPVEATRFVELMSQAIAAADQMLRLK